MKLMFGMVLFFCNSMLVSSSSQNWVSWFNSPYRIHQSSVVPLNLLDLVDDTHTELDSTILSDDQELKMKTCYTYKLFVEHLSHVDKQHLKSFDPTIYHRRYFRDFTLQEDIKSIHKLGSMTLDNLGQRRWIWDNSIYNIGSDVQAIDRWSRYVSVSSEFANHYDRIGLRKKKVEEINRALKLLCALHVKNMQLSPQAMLKLKTLSGDDVNHYFD